MTVSAGASTPATEVMRAFPAPPPPPPASANVYNLQQRATGILPITVDIPRSGVSYRFLRPLVLNEETKLNFAYKSK